MNISIITLAVVFLLIAIRQIGNIRLKIWQVMLGGALTVILTGAISPRAAFHAINFDVIFFLFGMFIIGSVMSPIGNPQNLLIAMVGNIENPFLTFLKHLLIPTILNLFLTYYLLKIFYKKDFNTTHLQPGNVAITHVRLSKVARTSLILVICLIFLKVALALINLYADVNFDFKLTYIALVGCSPILIYRFMSKKKKYRFHILRKIWTANICFFVAKSS